MRHYQKIVGERLYLSPLDLNDADFHEAWAAWMNDRVVADYYGGYHNLVTTEAARKTIEGLSGYRFAIVLLDSDELIGHISLHDVDHLNRNAFFGMFIGEEQNRGKGYGAEALRLLLGFGFKTLNLHNIMLSVHADNAAGIACYSKVGFKEVGRRRDWVFKNGAYVDKVYMDLLDSEYKG